MGRPERRAGALAAAALLTAAVAGSLVVGVSPAAADPLITCPETPVIHQMCSVATAVPNLAADGVEGAVGGIFDQLTEWVVSGAKSAVGFMGKAIDDSTRPDPGASWFAPNYRLMIAVGVALLLPLVLVGALSALLRQDTAGLVRMVAVKVPLAAMGMVVATFVVNLLILITDNLSGFVGSTIGGSGEELATGIVHLMEAGVVTGQSGLAGSLAFLVALMIAFMALILWIELVVRQAAVLVATLFLPVGFAAMVWESTAHWLRKLAEGLLAFILAKFVITAIVAVGANALAAGGDHPGALILGAGILAVAVFTPYVLLSIIPLGTLAVAEGLSRRPLSATSQTMSTLYWGQSLLGGGGSGAGSGGAASGSGEGAATTAAPVVGTPAAPAAAATGAEGAAAGSGGAAAAGGSGSAGAAAGGAAAAGPAAAVAVPVAVAGAGAAAAGQGGRAGRAAAETSSSQEPPAASGGDGDA